MVTFYPRDISSQYELSSIFSILPINGLPDIPILVQFIQYIDLFKLPIPSLLMKRSGQHS
ncbi:hypothetical protein BDC45DRAFT_508726 [Circinella umbellata]|nr:hypothetical protein BDC45DRAFT_508726 [Circinella umbellata]